MSHLDQLYQDVILDHNKNPRNFGRLSPCTHASHGKNPLCGDDYWVDLIITKDRIEDIRFEGSGCAISKASASLMSSTLKGKSVQEALTLKDHFITLVTQDLATDAKKALGRLAIFEGVKKFPARVKCAALIWRALEDALQSSEGQVTTE